MRPRCPLLHSTRSFFSLSYPPYPPHPTPIHPLLPTLPTRKRELYFINHLEEDQSKPYAALPKQLEGYEDLKEDVNAFNEGAFRLAVGVTLSVTANFIMVCVILFTKDESGWVLSTGPGCAPLPSTRMLPKPIRPPTHPSTCPRTQPAAARGSCHPVRTL